MKRLLGTVTSPDALAASQRDRMFALLAHHFENVSRPTFERDLAEKQWVVILRDQALGEIRGFSTLMALDAEIHGQPVTAFFSGDTIVHRDYWGEPELATVWGNFVLSQVGTAQSRRCYWFLISKGYRTYKFLPLYFRDFYPRHDAPTPPFEQALMDALASAKYPGDYLSEEGVIRFSRPKDRLRPDLAEVGELRLADPHIRYFMERNPGYANGDELVCLAELSQQNLTPIARRVVARAMRAGDSAR